MARVAVGVAHRTVAEGDIAVGTGQGDHIDQDTAPDRRIVAEDNQIHHDLMADEGKEGTSATATQRVKNTLGWVTVLLLWCRLITTA
jgi:hypothetical protein